MPAAVLPDALTAVKGISDEVIRVDALLSLAPHLPRETLRAGAFVDALAAALAISDEHARAHALMRLAPRLPDALTAVNGISDEVTRTEVSAAITRHLPHHGRDVPGVFVHPYPSGSNFPALLNWHLELGTRPDGNPNQPGMPWTNPEFATSCGAFNEGSVRRWRAGQRPRPIRSIERALFGNNRAFADWLQDFRQAYFNLPEEMYEALPPAQASLDEALKEAERKQRPAAYRFSIRGEEIDVLPEAPEAEDQEFALDTYRELVAKTQELHDRLRRTNSAHRPCMSIERLMAALNVGFDQLRPGLLISRVRSIEADCVAYDNENARGELFADVLAMMNDTLQTARDLLSVFPIVRRIETERIALDLDRNVDAAPAVRRQMSIISNAAKSSEAVSHSAIDALSQNDTAIEEAVDPVLRTSLVADKVLVVRNFVSAAASKIGVELGELGNRSWLAFKDDLPKGIGLAARVAPLMVLVGAIVGPTAAIAAALPAFKPIANSLKKMISIDRRNTPTTEQKEEKPRGRGKGTRRPHSEYHEPGESLG